MCSLLNRNVDIFHYVHSGVFHPPADRNGRGLRFPTPGRSRGVRKPLRLRVLLLWLLLSDRGGHRYRPRSDWYHGHWYGWGGAGRPALLLSQPVALVLVPHDKLPTFSHEIRHQARVDILYEAGQERPVCLWDGVGLATDEGADGGLHPVVLCTA